jgi:hypothetical protein
MNRILKSVISTYKRFLNGVLKELKGVSDNIKYFANIVQNI